MHLGFLVVISVRTDLHSVRFASGRGHRCRIAVAHWVRFVHVPQHQIVALHQFGSALPSDRGASSIHRGIASEDTRQIGSWLQLRIVRTIREWIVAPKLERIVEMTRDRVGENGVDRGTCCDPIRFWAVSCTLSNELFTPFDGVFDQSNTSR